MIKSLQLIFILRFSVAETLHFYGADFMFMCSFVKNQIRLPDSDWMTNKNFTIGENFYVPVVFFFYLHKM
jgi:hypothetical protein